MARPFGPLAQAPPAAREFVCQGIYARRTSVVAASAALAATTGTLTRPAAQAAIPTPVTVASARSYSSQLSVDPEGSSTGCGRAEVPHWSTESGAGNKREVVPKRDGTNVQRDDTNVQQDSACAAVSGSWYSQQDGATWTAGRSLTGIPVKAGARTL